jgi:hypothetical protein
MSVEKDTITIYHLRAPEAFSNARPGSWAVSRAIALGRVHIR